MYALAHNDTICVTRAVGDSAYDIPSAVRRQLGMWGVEGAAPYDQIIQKKLTWLVSGRSPKAPASLSIWIWVLDTLGQARATSSMDSNCLPSRPYIRSQAALSPRPEIATKGGRILPSLMRNLVAWLS